jgi:hypothetical protein
MSLCIPHAYAGYMAKQMLKDEGINIPMVTTLHGTDITLVGNHPFINQQLLSVSINQILLLGFPKFERRHSKIIQYQNEIEVIRTLLN